MKTKVDLDEWDANEAWRRNVNALDFKDVEWVRGGKVIDVPPVVAEEWRFCGMNNTCFPKYVLIDDVVSWESVGFQECGSSENGSSSAAPISNP